MDLVGLDLFCGAGGASLGYSMAGFEMWGVDVKPMPCYPFSFVQADFNDLPGWLLESVYEGGFDFIHASPPCQHWSAMSNCQPGLAGKYPQLIEPARKFLRATGLPYVIENVPGSPLEDPVRLCGTSFGLRVNRHRLFESNFVIPQLACKHAKYVMNPHNAAGRRRMESHFGVKFGDLEPAWRREMGVDWMRPHDARESFPPVYTEHIGKALASWLALCGPESHAEAA